MRHKMFANWIVRHAKNCSTFTFSNFFRKVASHSHCYYSATRLLSIFFGFVCFYPRLHSFVTFWIKTSNIRLQKNYVNRYFPVSLAVQLRNLWLINYTFAIIKMTAFKHYMIVYPNILNILNHLPSRFYQLQWLKEDFTHKREQRMKCFYSDLILAFKLCQTGLLITLVDHPNKWLKSWKHSSNGHL